MKSGGFKTCKSDMESREWRVEGLRHVRESWRVETGGFETCNSDMESGGVETHESDMESAEWMTCVETVTCLSPLHRPAHTSCHRSRPEHEGLWKGVTWDL